LSSTDTGNRIVRRVEGFLRRQGVSLIHKARASRFGPHDIFGGFDIAGLSIEVLRLAQVTTGANRSARRKKVQVIMRREFPAKGSIPGWLEVTVWAWGHTEARGRGFTVDSYLGGRSWTEEAFIPIAEVPLP
jgi:hypothetical protein